MALTRNEAQADGPAIGPTQADLDILIAAQIAEALAVATYTNIIHTSPFFTRLQSDGKGYLRAARQEEMSHHLLEKSVTNQDSPFIKFFYPKNMFANAQVTLNTLVTLEEAFFAAYLVGVRRFSTNNLKVTAARIMGIESDHRTLARVIAPGVAVQDGGPIEIVTGMQGVSESVDPPNNNGYERTAFVDRNSHLCHCRRLRPGTSIRLRAEQKRALLWWRNRHPTRGLAPTGGAKARIKPGLRRLSSGRVAGMRLRPMSARSHPRF